MNKKQYGSLGYLKLLSIFAVLLALQGCVVNKANKLYDQGKYIESVQTVTQYLDKSGKLPRAAKTKKLFAVVDGSIIAFEKMATKSGANEFDNKIYGYSGLLSIRTSLNNKFYSDEFASFNQKYTIPNLKLNVAEQYYLKGNAAPLNVINDYKLKADIYAKGLTYAEYKDMRALMLKYTKQYATLRADEVYKKGKDAVAVKNYKAASEYFAQATTYYSAYGPYKDSKALADKYEKIWRTQAAEDAYVRGKNAAQNGNYRTASEAFSTATSYYSKYGPYKNSKALAGKYEEMWRAAEAEGYYSQAQRFQPSRKVEHRQAAALYSKAYEVYRPIATYKDSYNLWQRHKSAGQVSIRVNVEGRGETSPSLSSLLERTVLNKFNDNYYTVSSFGSSDLTITVKYEALFRENTDARRENLREVTRDDGSIQQFTEVITGESNSYHLNVSISTSGDFSENDNFSVDSSSASSHVKYTGDVPSDRKYRESSTGSLKAKSSLERDIESETTRKLNRILDALYSRAERI